MSTLTALQTIKDAGGLKKVLIVAPLRVATHTWPNEVEKWDHINLTYRVIRGTPNMRKKQIASPADVYIINYENLSWLVDNYRHNWPFDVVVFDESSKMKSASSKRFKAFRKVQRFSSRVICLTGTPAPNGLLDLWAQVYLLDGGERLHPYITHYKNEWFNSDYMGYNWTPKYGADQDIQDRIKDICLSMQAKDYLELPEYISNVVKVYLTDQQMDQYKELQDEFYLELSAETSVTAANAAVLSSKCLQFSNGAMYLNDSFGNPTSDWEEIHTEKLNALQDIVDEANGAPVLVFYNYRSDLDRIKNQFKQAVELDKEGKLLNAWNAGRIPILLAHPASAGHGLNMQDGGNIVVWFGLNWSLELYQQANARLYRQGQTKPVFVHHIVAADTVDELVLDRLSNKRSVQDVLINALKETKAA